MRFLWISPIALIVAAMSIVAGQAQDAQQSSPIQVVKYVDIQPGQEKVALAALAKYANALHSENGNTAAILLEEAGRPSRFVVAEKWQDEPTYKLHLSAPAKVQLDKDIVDIRRAPDDERATMDFLAQGGGVAPASAFFVITHLDVNPPNRPATETALKALVDSARKESNVVQFDVFRPQTALNHFTIFEIWSNADAFNAHGMAPATLAFRQTVGPLIGALYDERVYRQAQ